MIRDDNVIERKSFQLLEKAIRHEATDIHLGRELPLIVGCAKCAGHRHPSELIGKTLQRVI